MTQANLFERITYTQTEESRAAAMSLANEPVGARVTLTPDDGTGFGYEARMAAVPKAEGAATVRELFKGVKNASTVASGIGAYLGLRTGGADGLGMDFSAVDRRREYDLHPEQWDKIGEVGQRSYGIGEKHVNPSTICGAYGVLWIDLNKDPHKAETFLYGILCDLKGVRAVHSAHLRLSAEKGLAETEKARIMITAWNIYDTGNHGTPLPQTIEADVYFK